MNSIGRLTDLFVLGLVVEWGQAFTTLNKFILGVKNVESLKASKLFLDT